MMLKEEEERGRGLAGEKEDGGQERRKKNRTKRRNLLFPCFRAKKKKREREREKHTHTHVIQYKLILSLKEFLLFLKKIFYSRLLSLGFWQYSRLSIVILLFLRVKSEPVQTISDNIPISLRNCYSPQRRHFTLDFSRFLLIYKTVFC